MDNQEIKKLLERYYLGQCSEQEKAWIETWYLRQPQMPLSNSIEELSTDLDEIELYLIRYSNRGKRVSMWPRLAVAAAILLGMSAGGYLLWQSQASKKVTSSQAFSSFVPGGNKATLKLSTGQQISLTDATVGAVTIQNGQTIRKTGEGTIVYQNNISSSQAQSPIYNTVTTPRGGQWSVVLPDGTQVMLDAASSVRYPVIFGKIRQVEVSGQVFFKVAHNPTRPFRVITKDEVIEDIGTAFNVNAYDDEPATKTVLVEGAINVSLPGAGAQRSSVSTLKPGQQAIREKDKIVVSEVNTEDAIAWKNGYFNFRDDNIESIMRKLSRWYNLDVAYQGKSSPVSFGGEIPRNSNLSTVLKILEAANIHFTIAGKKLIIKN